MMSVHAMTILKSSLCNAQLADEMFLVLLTQMIVMAFAPLSATRSEIPLWQEILEVPSRHFFLTLSDHVRRRSLKLRKCH